MATSIFITTILAFTGTYVTSKLPWLPLELHNVCEDMDMFVFVCYLLCFVLFTSSVS